MWKGELCKEGCARVAVQGKRIAGSSPPSRARAHLVKLAMGVQRAGFAASKAEANAGGVGLNLARDHACNVVVFEGLELGERELRPLLPLPLARVLATAARPELHA